MEVREQALGGYPCLVAGTGPPLVVLAGLLPEAGVGPELMRGTHERTVRGWARGRTVFYLNRRPGMPRGISMAEIAAEHAQALRDGLGAPADVLGISTGGSIAQQLAAEHPAAVRRLALMSTACRLGAAGARLQRQVAARVRAGAVRPAMALLTGSMVPPGPAQVLAAAAGWAFAPRWSSEGGLGDMATTIEAEDTFDLAGLPAIAAPTVLVAGGRDRFYPAELFAETAELIPGCRLELHPARGHITLLADPRAVRQVLGFLGGPPPPGSSASGPDASMAR